MNTGAEKRKEERLCCDWVIWLVDSVTQKRYHGMIRDLSSEGVAFICHGDDSFPQKDQNITAYFCVPKIESGDPYEVMRNGSVCRINSLDKFVRTVYVKFEVPLSFKPAELKSIAVYRN
ncbi:MAG: hypothetical protein HQ580_15630 [Planctomycetes bacterium]|nr:hypothetical protein [Planctomycetota bacterium]